MPTFGRSNIRAAKITPVQAQEIREKYDAGMTQRELCWQYNVSIGTIGRIVRGETWKDYGGPGEHPGASRPSVELNIHDSALGAEAMRNPLPTESAEIQASLARLAGLGIEVDKPKTEEHSDDSAGIGSGTADSTKGD